MLTLDLPPYETNDIDTYPLINGSVKLLVDVDYTDGIALIWFPFSAQETFLVGDFQLKTTCDEMVIELKRAFIAAAQIVQEETR